MPLAKDLDSYLAANRTTSRDELFEFLRIPSVSARSEHNADTARAAEWVADSLRTIGLHGDDPSDEGPSDRRRRMAERAARRADRAHLRPLRRAARRAARAVGQPAVRADGARRKDLRARIGRRQRPAVSAHQGARGAPRRARDAAGERHRARRGRGGSRQREPRGVHRGEQDIARVRRGRHLRLGDVRARAAVDSLVAARHRVLPDRRAGSGGRSALGHLRRRDHESGDGARAHPRHDARRRRPHRDSRVSTTRSATGATSRASRCKSLPFKDETLPRRDRLAGARSAKRATRRSSACGCVRRAR